MKAAIHIYIPVLRLAGVKPVIMKPTALQLLNSPACVVQLDRLVSFPSAEGMSFIKTHPSK